MHYLEVAANIYAGIVVFADRIFRPLHLPRTNINLRVDVALQSILLSLLHGWQPQTSLQLRNLPKRLNQQQQHLHLHQ
jgi:hypothetical protein